MNDSIYKMTLDIHEQATQAMVNARKYDTARQIDFIITQDGKPFLLQNCICTLRAVKPDGTVLFASCQTTNNNKTSYHFTNQTCTAVGFVDCELDIFGDNGKRIASPRFIIRVEDTTYSDEIIESENEFSALGEALLAASRVDADVSKSGKTATLAITNRDGVQKVVYIYDGEGGGGGGSVDDVQLDGVSIVEGGVANIPFAEKQDKLIAGENITIAADGKTISASGGGGVSKATFACTISGTTVQLSGIYTTTDIYNAISAGKIVQLKTTETSLGKTRTKLYDLGESNTMPNGHLVFYNVTTLDEDDAEDQIGIIHFEDGFATPTKFGTHKIIYVDRGGSSYEEGNGIDITDNVISVDTDVIQEAFTPNAPMAWEVMPDGTRYLNWDMTMGYNMYVDRSGGSWPRLDCHARQPFEIDVNGSTVSLLYGKTMQDVYNAYMSYGVVTLAYVDGLGIEKNYFLTRMSPAVNIVFTSITEDTTGTTKLEVITFLPTGELEDLTTGTIKTKTITF